MLLLCHDWVILWRCDILGSVYSSAHLSWYMFLLHCFSLSLRLHHVLTSVCSFLSYAVATCLKIVVYMCKFASPSGFDVLGDLLKPTIPTHTAPPPPPPPQMAIHPGGKLLANDLDSSLANLMGSECSQNMNMNVTNKWKETKDRPNKVKSKRKVLSNDSLCGFAPPQICSLVGPQPRSKCVELWWYLCVVLASALYVISTVASNSCLQSASLWRSLL